MAENTTEVKAVETTETVETNEISKKEALVNKGKAVWTKIEKPVKTGAKYAGIALAGAAAMFVGLAILPKSDELDDEDFDEENSDEETVEDVEETESEEEQTEE